MVSITLQRFDGFTDAQVEGTLDPSLPLVVLLHGLGGTGQDMTDPAAAWPGTAFARNTVYPLYTDRGFRAWPPVLPVDSLFLDPAASGLTSWQQALNTAGFTTLVYNQAGPLIAADATQLTALATGPLSTHSALSGLRIAFVAHSRGGLVARAFLTAAAMNPALAGFMGRVTSLVTLHSPHLGSGIASLGASIDGMLARIQALCRAMGVSPPGFLMKLRGMVLNPVTAELLIGSPTARVAAGEPVPGVMYHTFGGTSTAFARLWANTYTPDSFAPWPVPFPLFHWGVTPVLAGVPLDAASFIPAAALLATFPPVTELATVLGALVASTPELAPGSGDILVTDARARLPFSASHTTNPLNHAEALWDRTLQGQVVSILSRLRTPTASGQAVTRITPYPVRMVPAAHTVTASDAITGAPITTGSVTVRDTFGGVALQAPLSTPFTYAFRGRRIIVIDGQGHRTQEAVFPTVVANLPVPYGTVAVDTGQA